MTSLAGHEQSDSILDGMQASQGELQGYETSHPTTTHTTPHTSNMERHISANHAVSPTVLVQNSVDGTLAATDLARAREQIESQWRHKITTTYKALRDVEYMFHVYAETRNQPKLDAVKVMLETIVTCLAGGGNVHTFMDDPEWVAAHSSLVYMDDTETTETDEEN